MKKLILLVLFLVPFIYGQNIWDTGTGEYLSDSLWNNYLVDTVGVDDTLFTPKTSVMIPLDFSYDFGNITAIDTGSSYTDTAVVQYAIFDRNKTGMIDTIWQPLQFMRDSSWTNTNLIPTAASVKSYSFFVGDKSLIRVYMTNVEAIINRIFYFKMQLSKKK